MADEPVDKPEKTAVEESREIIAQLKEIQHYSKTNIEKLTGFWLKLEDELKRKKKAAKVEELISHQNTFHTALETLIEDWEIECNRIENES